MKKQTDRRNKVFEIEKFRQPSMGNRHGYVKEVSRSRAEELCPPEEMEGISKKIKRLCLAFAEEPQGMVFCITDTYANMWDLAEKNHYTLQRLN